MKCKAFSIKSFRPTWVIRAEVFSYHFHHRFVYLCGFTILNSIRFHLKVWLAFLTRVKVAFVHNIQREGQIYSYASSNMQKSCCHANRKNDLKLLHRYMKLQSNKLLFMLGRDRTALCYKCEAKLVIYKSWWAISIMQPTIFTFGRVIIFRSWKFMTQK